MPDNENRRPCESVLDKDATAWICCILNVAVVAITVETPPLVAWSLVWKECEERVPGLRITPGRGVSAPWQLRFNSTQGLPKVVAPCYGHLELSGDPLVLTPGVWSDLILSLAAQCLSLRGWFFIGASAIRVGPEVLLLVNRNESAVEAVAYHLYQRGYEVLSTGLSLVSGELVFLSGTRRSRISSFLLHRYFPERAGDAPSASQRTPVEVSTCELPAVQADVGFMNVERICHLHLQRAGGECREIAARKERMVLSSQLISRYACRPAVIGPWRVIAPRSAGRADTLRCQEAIHALANRLHHRVFGGLDAMPSLLNLEPREDL